MLKIPIWKIPYSYFRDATIPFKLEERGYIKSPVFDKEGCWHICNWSCWASQKPNNLHSDVDVANSDIIFHNPEENKYHLALPTGWLTKDTMEEIIDYCKTFHISKAK